MNEVTIAKGTEVDILEYELQGSWSFELSMPVRAEVLTVRMRDHVPVLWVLADLAEQRFYGFETRRFLLLDTNRPVLAPGDLFYLGSFQTDAGMRHLFEDITEDTSVERA